MAAMLVACGGKKESSGSAEPAAQEKPDKPAEAKPKKRMPRGHAAYSGEATTGTEGMESAPDPQIVALSGDKVALSSTWKSGPSVIVFYRGHW